MVIDKKLALNKRKSKFILIVKSNSFINMTNVGENPTESSLILVKLKKIIRKSNWLCHNINAILLTKYYLSIKSIKTLFHLVSLNQRIIGSYKTKRINVELIIILIIIELFNLLYLRN